MSEELCDWCDDDPDAATGTIRGRPACDECRYWYSEYLGSRGCP